MKKSLLFAAALFATTSVYAVDFYVIGSDVNGQSWALMQADAKMTETSAGVYEWEGQTLATEFKINDGTWDAEWNIGAGEGEIKLDTPYTYSKGDGSQNIKFDGFDFLNSPKVVLNINNGTITLSGTPGEKEPVEPGDVTFYMIGSNVNGNSWTLAAEDAKFTDEGNGVYRWKGDILSTGFKINDGTWSNPEYNIGSGGTEIYMNTPFYYVASGDSGNIAFAGFTEIKDPEVVLNLNDETITIVGGTPDGKYNLYIIGINENYDLNETTILAESEENIYERQIVIETTAGGFKISDDGYAHQFGTNDPENFFIDPDNMEVQLEPVYSQGGDVPYELEAGSYVAIFDYNELIAKFVDSSGVETILMGEDAAAVYYNLHGMKVNNPEKGIFVKVVNGKAIKVVK